MTRQPSDINPNNVFPPSDLPGTAQAWGRVVEDREIALEKGYIAHGQSLDGLNRTLKGNMANTAEQINALTAAQSTLATMVAELATTQASLVTTKSSSYENNSTNTIAQASYLTLPSALMTVPAGYTKMTVMGSSIVRATNNTAASDYLKTILSFTAAGFTLFQSALTSDPIVAAGAAGTARNSYIATRTVTPGESVSLAVGVKCIGATSWTSTAVYARVDLIGIFSK